MLKLQTTCEYYIYFNYSITVPPHTFPIYGDKIGTYRTKNPEQYLHTVVYKAGHEQPRLYCNETNLVIIPSKKSHSLKTLL